MLEDFMTACTRYIEFKRKDGYYFDSARLQASGGGANGRPRGMEEADGMPFEGRGRATQQQQSGLRTGKPVLVDTVRWLATAGLSLPVETRT
jgi:hypothetical protein